MYEKLKEIFSGVRLTALFLLTIAGLVHLFRWFFDVFIPARGRQLIDWLADQLPTETINLSGVGLDWARINQWIPLSEALSYGSKFLVIAGSVVFIRWVSKMMPMGAGK